MRALLPERSRDRNLDDLPLCLLADALDPPPAEETAADPERWLQAVSDARASLGLPSPERR